MKTVACVQSRMGSSRLPGKAMLELDGKPIIGHVLERANAATLVDEVVLATTWGEEDDVLAAYAKDNGFRSYAGSDTDVLRRVREAAEYANADVVVRLTGDCPRLEPAVIDRVIKSLGPADYCSNIVRRTFPKGLDCEALHMDTLTRIDRLATSDQARASVTWFCYKERLDLFELRSVEQEVDESDVNLCVDTAEDLERLRALCAEDRRPLHPSGLGYLCQECLGDEGRLVGDEWIPCPGCDGIGYVGSPPEMQGVG